MILMKKRRKMNYVEVLEWMKSTYFAHFNEELHVPFFHCDCEKAFISAVEKCFKNSGIIAESSEYFFTFDFKFHLN